jgi:type IV fimbrial biogenesis protein FimT
MPRRQRAFTLIELTIVALIVAAGAVIAVPAVGHAIAAAQARTASRTLAHDLAMARRAAIDRDGHVVACASRDGLRCTPGARWHHGWIVQHGRVVLSVHDALPRRVASDASDGRPHIRFGPGGTALGSNTTITFCARNRPGTGHSAVVSGVGRIHGGPAQSAHGAACAASREIRR